MKRAERLHALAEELRRAGTRGVTAERLAREFAVSVRTVKRDLAALETSGAPVWSRPGPGGGYGLAAGTSLPAISFSPAQAVGLLAAVAAASDAPYSDLAAAGVRKIVDVLDPRTRARADALAGRIWVDAPPPASRAIRSALEEAMADQRVVRIRRRGRDHPRRRTRPLRLDERPLVPHRVVPPARRDALVRPLPHREGDRHPRRVQRPLGRRGRRPTAACAPGARRPLMRAATAPPSPR